MDTGAARESTTSESNTSKVRLVDDFRAKGMSHRKVGYKNHVPRPSVSMSVTTDYFHSNRMIVFKLVA